MQLRAGTTLLVSRQYQQSGPDQKWHEQVIRYESGLNPPSGSLQVVLLAGVAPPEGGGDDPGQAEESDESTAREDDASIPAASSEVESAETDLEPLDQPGYVRFDDVRLTKMPTMPRYLFQGRDFDRETGTYNFRLNHMDPKTGKFLTEDKAQYDLDNLTRFEFNQPVENGDPFGLAAVGFGRTAGEQFNRIDPSAFLDPLAGLSRFDDSHSLGQRLNLSPLVDPPVMRTREGLARMLSVPAPTVMARVPMQPEEAFLSTG